MKAIPFTIHEIKGGQVLTQLAEQETEEYILLSDQQPAAVNDRPENGADPAAVE